MGTVLQAKVSRRGSEFGESPACQALQGAARQLPQKPQFLSWAAVSIGWCASLCQRVARSSNASEPLIPFSYIAVQCKRTIDTIDDNKLTIDLPDILSLT